MINLNDKSCYTKGREVLEKEVKVITSIKNTFNSGPRLFKS